MLDAREPPQNFDVLNPVEGSFACVYQDPRFAYPLIFRNDTAPLYVNSLLDISSTPFTPGSQVDLLPAQRVYELQLYEGYLRPISDFKNIDHPYFFA